MIDFHTHSTASDGSYSPTDLVQLAVNSGISVLALTDHDTVAGIEEAQRAAISINKGLASSNDQSLTKIQVVAGVELAIEWKTGEFHLLGLGLKQIHPDLQTLINALISDRNKRNAEMSDAMTKAGIPVNLSEVEALAMGGTVGRPHFAQYLVEKKLVKNRQQAFDKYLAKNRPFYIERHSIPLDAAILAIKACGGVPIIAHPMSLYVSWGSLPDLIKRFSDQGIMGLEAWHPGARVNECKRLEALAHDLGLCVTAGSDFHGAARPDRKIGFTSGGQPIQDKYFFEELAPLLG